MEFLHPNFLYLLALLVLLSIFKFFYSSNKSASFQVSDTKYLKSFFGKSGIIKIGLFRFLFIASLVCFIIAIARPRISTNDKNITIEVVDIMLVLDTSSSMLAEDFKPNRLEAVKQAAKDFIDNRRGDRVGLLVFGKETFIQCPLTVDYGVLNNLLSEVTVVEPKYDGTAIGIAIANAINRLRVNESKSKVIILLSDGSNNSGAIDPIAAAKIAKEYDIRIYTIGAGTRQAVTQIPGGRYIRNEIDEDSLRGIAAETGGKYFRAIDKESLAGIYAEINDLEKSEIIVSYYSEYQEAYLWFLYSGFVLLLLSELFRVIYFRRIV
jgi:Ca-activated chloride channel family protein